MAFFLQQIIATDYRAGLFKQLADHNSVARFVYSGRVGFDAAQCTHDVCKPYIQPVKNHYYLKRHICWQRGIVVPLVQAKQVILNFNVRTLSNWKILSARHRAGKKTILWGHASGTLPASISRPAYALHLSKANGFITYTKSQQKVLEESFPNLPTWAAPNACMRGADSYPDPEADQTVLTDVLYVGRLKGNKKPLLLAKAFRSALAANLLPDTTRLVYVGSGNEAEKIQNYARKHGFKNRLVMHGHVSDVNALREIYGKSFVAVSPGYASLSVTQALAFGNWLLIADNEPHSPEIEAVEPGFNGQFFAADDPDALAAAIQEAWQNRAEHFDCRPDISTKTRQNYSFEAMAKAFVNALEYCRHRNRD